jgi:hypothetical protein
VQLGLLLLLVQLLLLVLLLLLLLAQMAMQLFIPAYSHRLLLWVLSALDSKHVEARAAENCASRRTLHLASLRTCSSLQQQWQLQQQGLLRQNALLLLLPLGVIWAME